MPLALQAKLLRVLENGEVVRIGANEPIRVDVRIITATNRDLDAAVKGGKFRLDLYHRLKVGVIRLPSLRDRKEDIPQLATHFLKDLAKRHGKPVPKVAGNVWRAFEAYDWHGNVRELRNLLDSMIVLDLDGELTLDDLPEDAGIRPSGLSGGPVQATSTDHLTGRPLEEVERYYMEKALEMTRGNREEAAKILGIGERTLYRKIQQWKDER
jgi:two-component system response regulator HydG